LPIIRIRIAAAYDAATAVWQIRPAAEPAQFAALPRMNIFALFLALFLVRRLVFGLSLPLACIVAFAAGGEREKRRWLGASFSIDGTS
jgi:hypothetical protein